jgi:CubicO group peptidase (beta-lactamase class C family)
MNSARDEFKGVTLAHLLAHEAGLQPMEEDVELDGVPELTGDIRSRRRQFARWIFRQAPAVEPMGDYRYSNAHFVVAASMAEAVSGKSWEELIEEHVFAELEFGRAGFGWPGKQGEEFPWGHMFRDNKFRAVDPNGDYQLPAYFAPAGDVHASLADMAGFLRAYLQAWQGKGNYLHPDLVRRMLTRRLGSGLGWGATKAFDHEPVATYSGSADTFLTIVVMIPDADVAVAIVANAYSELVEQALVQALREIVRLHVAKAMPD